MKARPAGTESVITSTGYGAGGNAAGVVCIYRHRSETIHRGGERPAIISEGRLVIVEIQVQCAIALRCETAAGAQLDVALAAGAELRLDGSIDNIGVRRAAHFTAEIGPPTPIAVRGLTGSVHGIERHRYDMPLRFGILADRVSRSRADQDHVTNTRHLDRYVGGTDSRHPEFPSGPIAPAKKPTIDRKSTRLNSSHRCISYAV